MHIVIEIPEDIYQYVINTGTYGHYHFNSAKAIKNGIPLPKGHGDLIDRSMLPTDYITDDDIADVSAIIEADKS